jgi:hypothetical protein
MNDSNKLELLEIKPPLELENGDGSSTMWWLLVVLLIGGAALLFWALHKPAQPTARPKPDEVARRKLREAWALLGTPVLFIEATADILRVYLEERFNAQAPERTTEEFLSELQSMPQMTGKQKELLSQFLRYCDFPKFARLDPTEEECRQLHAAAVKIVNETAPTLPGSIPPRIEPPKINP